MKNVTLNQKLVLDAQDLDGRGKIIVGVQLSQKELYNVITQFTSVMGEHSKRTYGHTNVDIEGYVDNITTLIATLAHAIISGLINTQRQQFKKQFISITILQLLNMFDEEKELSIDDVIEMLEQFQEHFRKQKDSMVN